ncbi:MAG TPA: amidohydrolase family protein [Candidatus Binataceae bacterium]|nr:amidohydrolase family protein [Candidatus Binataceae bacterium]
MNGYKDAHTHIHASASATKAFMNALEFHGPWDGTIEQALPIMDKAGIATTMIVPLIADSKLLAERMEAARAHGAKPDRDEMIAQLAAEQSAFNSWAARAGARHQERFAGLIAVNPVLFGAQWTRTEIAARLAEGAAGIKILPMYIGVYPADPRMAVVWEEADRRGLTVLTLATAEIPGEALGKIGVSERLTDIHHPSRFEDVVRSYPRLKLVLAHLGLGAEQDTIRLANKYPNVFTDTSLRLHEVGQPGKWSLAETAEIFRRIGIDRVLFGTNYPFVGQADYVAVMEQMPLNEDERRRIGADNYDRLYAAA